MHKTNFPPDRLHRAIVDAINSKKLTDAGLGAVLSPEIDESPRTCAQRVRRLKGGLPLQVIDLSLLLDAIGFELRVVKK